MSTTAIGTYKVGRGGGEVVRTGTTSNQTQGEKIGPHKGSFNESFKGIKIFGFKLNLVFVKAKKTSDFECVCFKPNIFLPAMIIKNQKVFL